MDNYAVIKSGGREYKVKEGQTLIVDRINEKEGEIINISPVLLTRLGKDITIGKPYVSDIPVTARVIKHQKGKKIDVYKFKAKVRYRRHIGFRALETVLLIEKIGNSGGSILPKAAASKAKKTTTRKSKKSSL